MMEKFDFLLGNWKLEYRIPKSAYSEAGTGAGTGTIRRALHNNYVFFDYSAASAIWRAEAHAVFAWDKKADVYRYSWFEDSGNFMTATCNFVNDDTLCLNWHNSLFVQSFTKQGPDKVVLRMEHPNSEGKYELVLEVLFTRA